MFFYHNYLDFWTLIFPNNKNCNRKKHKNTLHNVKIALFHGILRYVRPKKIAPDASVPQYITVFKMVVLSFTTPLSKKYIFFENLKINWVFFFYGFVLFFTIFVMFDHITCLKITNIVTTKQKNTWQTVEFTCFYAILLVKRQCNSIFIF